VKGRRGLDRSGNHHVTAHGTGSDSRTRVSVPWRWKAPWVVEFVSSSRRGERSGLGDPNRAFRAKARRGRNGSDGGVRGTAESGAPEKQAERRPDKARRSGSGIVKRQVHRSPGRECRLVGQGRGASLEEMPVAHEAWVLVVEAVGSRSRSYASCSRSRASRKVSRRRAN